MLSKKYYKAIAQAINVSEINKDSKENVVKSLNEIFIKDNPKFRADFFEKMALGMVLTPHTENTEVKQVKPASSLTLPNELITTKRKRNKWVKFDIQGIDFLNNNEIEIIENKDMMILC